MLSKVICLRFYLLSVMCWFCFANQFAWAQDNQLDVGDDAFGGIVLYVDSTGKHGKVAMPFDQAERVSCGKKGSSKAKSATDGSLNMAMIVEVGSTDRSANKYAANYCENLSYGGHEDWYLPAIDELYIMYINKEEIGNFKFDDYCSSTEATDADSWNIHFDRSKDKCIFFYNKGSKQYNVRCIRKF